MIKIVDFTNLELSSRNMRYGGRAGAKRGIIYNGDFWMVKFPKDTKELKFAIDMSYSSAPLSEYIGSKIYEIMGFDVQEVKLGIFFDGKRNKLVCGCKDFLKDENYTLVSYTMLRNDSKEEALGLGEERGFGEYTLDEISHQLEENTVLSKIPGAKERFWRVVVMDLLINNNDRNDDNWGLIYSEKEDKYTLAPIYDNGASFHSKVSDNKISNLMADPPRLMSSVLNGVAGYHDDKGNSMRNADILNYANRDLDAAILYVGEKFQERIGEIKRLFSEIPEYYKGIEVFTKQRKAYYMASMLSRYQHIIQPAMERIKEKEDDFCLE